MSVKPCDWSSPATHAQGWQAEKFCGQSVTFMFPAPASIDMASVWTTSWLACDEVRPLLPAFPDTNRNKQHPRSISCFFCGGQRDTCSCLDHGRQTVRRLYIQAKELEQNSLLLIAPQAFKEGNFQPRSIQSGWKPTPPVLWGFGWSTTETGHRGERWCRLGFSVQKRQRSAETTGRRREESEISGLDTL